jgi:hypothetical protein
MPIFSEVLGRLLEDPPAQASTFDLPSTSLAFQPVQRLPSVKSSFGTIKKKIRKPISYVTGTLEDKLSPLKIKSIRFLRGSQVVVTQLIRDCWFWLSILTAFLIGFALYLYLSTRATSAAINGSHDIDPASLLKALPVATVLVMLSLGAWQACMLRKRTGNSAPLFSAILKSTPQQICGDDTFFRVSSLGGSPPRFLSPNVAQEIAEMFTYRAAEPDPGRLDIARTIGALVRGEDPAGIYFESKRQLPTVLLLVDSNSPAKFWNTLPNEFAAALTRWGVSFERVDFPGSFFINVGLARRARPEVELIESAIAAPGWTVTTIFAETRRLARPDIELLRRVVENGPVLFLDLSDPILWDAQQVALANLDITVVPATGRDLRDGLARLFAPDRVLSEAIVLPNGPRLPSSKNDHLAFSILGPEGLAWASECALVEPISFALAERLRRHHSVLGQPSSSLAFSLLAALPGSWIGPEGLRFDAPTRRRLLGAFAQRTASERTAAIALINEAFDNAVVEGKTAKELRRYARAQVGLFDTRPDEALQEIDEIFESGIVDRRSIVDLIGRIQPLSYETPLATKQQAEPIRIPGEPWQGRNRVRLTKGTGAYSLPQRKVLPARWVIATPEIRFRVPGQAVERVKQIQNGKVATAFLPSGDEILVDGGHDQKDEQTTLLLLNAVNATYSPIRFQGGREVKRIVTARGAKVATVLFDQTTLFVAHGIGGGEQSEKPRNVVRVELETWVSQFTAQSNGLFFTLDVTGGLLAVRGPSGNEIGLFDTESGARRKDGIVFDNYVVDFAFNDGQTATAVLGNGQVVQIDLANAADREKRIICKLDTTPTAVGVLQADRTKSSVIVGLEDGRIMLVAYQDADPREPGSIRELACLKAPTRSFHPCRPTADYAAAWIERKEDAEEAGQCVAVLMTDDSFDLLGLPIGPNGQVLTAVRDQVTTESISSEPSVVETDAPLFAAMSLLERRIGPEFDGSQIVAISRDGRKVAAVRANRVEVRPIVYEPPDARAVNAMSAAVSSSA